MHLTILAWRSVGNDRFTQYKNNVTEGDIESWYSWLDLPVGQYYKAAKCVCSHKSVPVLI